MGIFSKLFRRQPAKGPETVVSDKPKAAPKKAATKPAAKKAPAKKAAAKPAAKKDYQPQCAALTAAGKQCANSARGGSKYCGSHKGYQPPKRATARAQTNTAPRHAGAADTAASGRRKAGAKQCAAKTKAGSQCKRDAIKGGKYCASHKTT